MSDDGDGEGNSFPPFVRGSDTSEEAAESVADITGRMRRLKGHIFDFDTRACKRCGVSEEAVKDLKAPMDCLRR